MNAVTHDDDRPSIFLPALDASCAMPERRPAGASAANKGRRTNRRKHRRNVTHRRRR